MLHFGGEETCTLGFGGGILKCHLGDLSVDGRVTLKWTSKKWDEAWTRLIWLRIRPGSILIWPRIRPGSIDLAQDKAR